MTSGYHITVHMSVILTVRESLEFQLTTPWKYISLHSSRKVPSHAERIGRGMEVHEWCYQCPGDTESSKMEPLGVEERIETKWWKMGNINRETVKALQDHKP